MDADTRCPCGSGDTYGNCCRPFHHGKTAPTAETLMRSRFSGPSQMSVGKGPSGVRVTGVG